MIAKIKEKIRIIKHWLYKYNKILWKAVFIPSKHNLEKKNTNIFDISMGSFWATEICEIVSILMFSTKLK